jgi:hypothetical protein
VLSVVGLFGCMSAGCCYCDAVLSFASAGELGSPNCAVVLLFCFRLFFGREGIGHVWPFPFSGNFIDYLINLGRIGLLL